MLEIIQSSWIIIIRTVVIIAFMLIARRAVYKIFDANKWSSDINVKYIKNILISVIIIIGVLSILSQLSGFKELANTIIAGSGLIAVIVGLAAQESFSPIISGLIISIFKPFNIGDRVRVVGNDTAGFIEDMNLRHTVLRTYLNVRIIVPNSIMANAQLENSTYAVGAAYPIDITIEYGTKEKRYKAIKIIEEVVTSHELFYDKRTDEEINNGAKPVEVTCTALGDNGINLRVLMWTKSTVDNNKACSDCRLRILDRLEEEGIDVPCAQLNIIGNNISIKEQNNAEKTL